MKVYGWHGTSPQVTCAGFAAQKLLPQLGHCRRVKPSSLKKGIANSSGSISNNRRSPMCQIVFGPGKESILYCRESRRLREAMSQPSFNRKVPLVLLGLPLPSSSRLRLTSSLPSLNRLELRLLALQRPRSSVLL